MPFRRSPRHKLIFKYPQHKRHSLIVPDVFIRKGLAEPFIGHPLQDCFDLPFVPAHLLGDLFCRGRSCGHGVAEIMASPHKKLAVSLKALRALQDRGVVAVRSRDLIRTHQERLVKNGLLQEVMKGWYIPARPGDATGESTAWYASF
jgi:hypothetical protein